MAPAGFYSGGSISGTQWTDISGSNNHATLGGTVTTTESCVNGAPCAGGGIDTTVRFPQAS
jgi:hypothetical protein